MTTPASPPPGVYHSRSRVTRNRVALAAAGLALVLLGYLIGRLQGGSATPAAVAAPTPSAAVSATPTAEPSPEPSTAPASAAPTTPAGIDAYSTIQAEAASGQQGTEFENTQDQGGGQNVGWINNGDWLRFDDVNFGDTPATQFAARVSSDTDDGGRVEVRIDSPGNPPAGTLTVENTDGWQNWQTRTTGITPTTGLHTVFLTFASDDDSEFMNLNYFAFGH
jgi:hypothetical protein